MYYQSVQKKVPTNIKLDLFLFFTKVEPLRALTSTWGVASRALASAWGVANRALASAWGVASRALASAWGVASRALASAWGVASRAPGDYRVNTKVGIPKGSVKKVNFTKVASYKGNFVQRYLVQG